MDKHIEIIHRFSQPMEPIPTDTEPRLQTLSGIRAAIFDVYGTLLISASGDVGTVAAAPGEAIGRACEAVGLKLSTKGEVALATLVESIRASQNKSRQRGIEFPEVDILQVWRRTLESLARQGFLHSSYDSVDLPTLAIEYEVRVNPVWPMPGLQSCLETLHAARIRLGIVSNAQFFTPLLFPALLQRTYLELGFEKEFCSWSYEHGQAKPGEFLYMRTLQTLASAGIQPHEVLYVGNDMLNDITPARQVGFRTALFAGDRRSLRLRNDDPRVRGVDPDLTVTSLEQVAAMLVAPGTSDAKYD